MFNLFFALAALPYLKREELRDHAFGDCEVFISFGASEVGVGYFGGSHCGLSIYNFHFEDDVARIIRQQIPLGKIDRNDETGPDNFAEGETIPGLTLSGVFNELTGD